MTDQPPPGGPVPPPPPPSGASGEFESPGAADKPGPAPSAPPPPGPAIRTLPTEAYAPWLTRALAFIIDILPYVVLHAIGTGILLATQQQACVADIGPYSINQYCVTQYSGLGTFAQGLFTLIGIAYLVWNYGYRQGQTGSSLGKSVMKIKVVSEVTGEPLGFGMSVVRQFAHIVDAVICFVGFLFPLWDAKRQTLADKMMTTIVLPIEQ